MDQQHTGEYLVAVDWAKLHPNADKSMRVDAEVYPDGTIKILRMAEYVHGQWQRVGAKTTPRRFNDEEVERMRQEISHTTWRELAKRYQVSLSTLHQVLNGHGAYAEKDS